MPFLRNILLLLLLTLSAGAQSPQTRVWLTVSENDTLNAQIGMEYQVDVHIDTRGEYISGLQLFWSFPEHIMEPVRWETTTGNLGWIQSNAIFPYSVLFSGHHSDRPLNEHMSGERLDWIVQTGTSQNGERPAFQAVGILCSFHIRITGAIEGHQLGFDHNNFYFRNSLYWRDSEDREYNFNQERPLVLNVVGVSLEPLPDVYLTSAHPVDSLNLFDHLEQSSSVDPALIRFNLSPLTNSVCNLDTVRTADAFWLIASDNGGPGEVHSQPVTAMFAATTSTQTYRVFKGEPPQIADTLRNPDALVRFFEDETFLLPFNEYVVDPNNDVSTLSWTVTEIDPALSLVINPATHVGIFSALPNWAGTGQVTVCVEDSIGMADVAVIPVVVLPVNDAPELDFGTARIPVNPDRQTILDLQEVTSDVDNTWNELFWSSPSDTSLVALRIDSQARTLTIVVQDDTPLFTPVDFLVRVDDLDGGFDTDTLRVLVNSHPPIWQAVDDVVFLSSQTASRNLNDYLSDEDNNDDELLVEARGQQRIQVSITSQTHIATFRSLSPSWRGVERVILTATDPDLNTDEDTLLAVSLLGNSPTVGDFQPLLLWAGQQFGPIPLDQHVWDLDTPVNQMQWTLDHNQVFGVSLNTEARTATVNAPGTRGLFDWITWRASDPEGHSGSQTSMAVVVDSTGLPTILPFRELLLSTFASDSSILLDEHIHDVVEDAASMLWTLQPNPRLTAELLEGRRLRITSGSETGRDTLWLAVADPLGNSASGFVPLRVIEGTPPVVSEFPPRYIIAGQVDTLEQVSSYVYDQDEGDVISWSFVPPADSPLSMIWEEQLDRVLIQTDPDHLGIDLFTLLAQDLSQNVDSAQLEIHSLENVAPGITLGVLANGANPALLDLVALSDERLGAPPQGSVEETVVPFVGLGNPSGSSWIFRADLALPEGQVTVHVRSQDIVGNIALDSLVLASGTLGQAAIGFPSPDGRLWIRSDSESRWALRSLDPKHADSWQVISFRSGERAELEVSALAGQRLEKRSGSGWQALPSQIIPGGLRVMGITAGEYRLADGVALPASFRLNPPVPNPFNPSTRLELELPGDGRVQLVVYDMLGRRVRVLLDQELPAGVHSLRWDGTNAEGRPVASGPYVARLSGPQGAAHQKMLLLR